MVGVCEGDGTWLRESCCKEHSVVRGPEMITQTHCLVYSDFQTLFLLYSF